MNSRVEAAYVIERMEVRDVPRAYVLGCRAPRVTVLSQQFRAFNLIWALFEEGRLKAGDRVGIVGGGIGGLTTAAAAMIKGCSVVLTEQRQQLMHLQRRNTTRLLHPNIYEWPSPGSDEGSTRFPCMNWTADLAGEVVTRLDVEWDHLVKHHPAQVHMEMRITSVNPCGSDGRLVLRKGDEWMSDPCDVVVLAVGFGVEPPAPGLSLDSYWENDKLEQSTRGSQEIRSVLVSGLGDGGCIDVLRLKYANFQHAKFATAVARHQELEQYKQRLSEIDRDMPQSGQDKYLRDEYARLGLPANLADSLGTIRSDTRVVINGPDPTSPLSPNACILHRVAVWALVIGRKVEYKPGRIDKESITAERVPTGFKYFVPLEGSGKLGFDAVVIRHGPAPCLGYFEKIANSYSGILETAADDRTRHKMYPDGFYPMPQFAPPSMTPQLDVVFSGSQPDVSVPARSAAVPIPGNFSTAPSGSVRLNAPDSTPNAAFLIEIELLTARLIRNIRAENFLPAAEDANALDTFLTQVGAAIPADVWHRTHQVLFDFELFARKRVESNGGRYDLDGLRNLMRRMHRGPQ